MVTHLTRWRRLVAAATIVVLAAGVVAAPGVRADDGHHDTGETTAAPEPVDGRVGVLIADHGEPPEYNAWTYESFREFFAHLMAMGIVPSWLTVLDSGTIVYDADCPACDGPSDSPRLIDAWLRPHDGPAVFVPASDSLAAHYVIPGGPGLREPDIYEHVGLAAWHEWQRMGGRSPNYGEKLAKKQAVIERLRASYGDDLAIRVGYGIDPRIGGGRQGIREALDALVNRDRVASLVVVYHGVGFSDIMQTHHLRHQIAEHLDTLGAGDLPIRYAEPLGTTDHYVAAIVEKVQAELAVLPPDAAVAIHLSGHGLPTTTCGDYDCGADAYHRYAADLFARVRPAVEAAIDRPGRTGVFAIYGDGGEGDADPGNEVASPIEALDARAAEGFTHVVDIPYEFDSNSRDTLIVLRQGYGRPQPDWNASLESHFTRRGLQVKIANASGGQAHKIDALEAVTRAALDGLVDPAAGSAAGGETGHGGHGIQASGDEEPGVLHAVAHPAAVPAVAADDTHDHRSSTGPFDSAGHGDHRDEDNVETAAAGTAAGHHHAAGGAGSGTGFALVVSGAAALALAASARRRLLAGRLVAAGFGIQLAGLGWDVITHARAGEAVHLLENGGHWATLAGLTVSAAAAALLLGGRPSSEGQRSRRASLTGGSVA